MPGVTGGGCARVKIRDDVPRSRLGLVVFGARLHKQIPRILPMYMKRRKESTMTPLKPFLPIFVLLLVCFPQASYGQEPCRCEFDTYKYSAIGTKAACNAYCYNKRNCEIAFSALGASIRTVRSIGLDVQKYRSDSYRITAVHIAALEKGDIKKLSSVNFLAEALPLFMRATYFREAVAKILTIDKIAELDKDIIGFLNDQIQTIAEVFSGKAKPLNGKWKDKHSYFIGVGVIRFTHASGADLVSVVFPAEGQP
jgi:hypothetical protein